MNALAGHLGERDALMARNVQLAGKVRSQQSRMAAFEAFDGNLTELADLGLLKGRVIEGVRQAIHPGAVLLLVEDDGHLRVERAHMEGDAEIARRVRGEVVRIAGGPFAEAPAGQAVRLACARELGLPSLATTALGERPALAMPLRAEGGDLLGAIVVADPRAADGSPRADFDASADAGGLLHFANLLGMAIERKRAYERMLWKIVKVVELRDPRETTAHVKRVSGISLELFDGWAGRHGLRDLEAEFARERLRVASTLHDVGKVGVSDLILWKPGKLDEKEYAQMKRHTVLGASCGWDAGAQEEDAREVMMNHHQRWDGRGYPVEAVDGSPIAPLAGHDIPLFARIVAVADVFDALSSRRSYKDPWPPEKVLEVMRDDAGKAFDPELIEILVERHERVRAVWGMHPDAPHAR
jgi:HD-GYP domain-containing protein (c-di-GMP phosphodiesterase class II)